MSTAYEGEHVPAAETGDEDVRLDQLMVLFGQSGLRPQTRQALQFALATLDIKGARGCLVIEIPSDPSKPLDCHFTLGNFRIQLEH